MASTHFTATIEQNSARGDVSADLHFVEQNESSLVAAARNGLEGAFDVLWALHTGKAIRVAQRITGNREDAEDAVQEAFLLAFTHLGRFDGRSSFATWLTRITINAALMIVRKKNAMPTISIAAPGSDMKNAIEQLPGAASDPEAAYARTERGVLLRRAIRELRPAARRAVELQQLQEHSIGETARRMGLTVPATKSRLHHAKAALRRSLVSIRPAGAKQADAGDALAPVA